MIIEKAFFGLPFMTRYLKIDIIEETVRSLFFNEILTELKRFIFHPEARIIMQKKYPNLPGFTLPGMERRYVDIFVDLSNLIPQINRLYGIKFLSNNWIEIKCFRPRASKKSNITKCSNIGAIIDTFLRLIVLPKFKDLQGRYLLVLFRGNYKKFVATLSRKKNNQRSWLNQLFDLEASNFQKVKIDWSNEVDSVIKKISKGFRDISSIEIEYSRLLYIEDRKGAYLNWFLFRIDKFRILKTSKQIPFIEVKRN